MKLFGRLDGGAIASGLLMVVAFVLRAGVPVGPDPYLFEWLCRQHHLDDGRGPNLGRAKRISAERFPEQAAGAQAPPRGWGVSALPELGSVGPLTQGVSSPSTSGGPRGVEKALRRPLPRPDRLPKVHP
jgi:hypothetical protein